MRLSRVRTLAGLLLCFFSRRVLSVGLLASRLTRVVLLTLLTALLVVAVAAARDFLEPLQDEAGGWVVLLDLASVSVVAWCLVAALFVKVLFLGSEGLVGLTTTLPVTNRERAAALAVYEAIVTALVVCAGAIALGLASLLVRGPTALGPLLQSIALPAALSYAAIALGYQLAARLLSIVGVRRSQPVVLILALFAVLVAYVGQVPGLVARASAVYLDGSGERPWTAGVAILADRVGTVLALGLAGVVVVLALTAAIALTPNRPPRQARFVTVVRGSASRWLTPEDRCALRSVQTWWPTVLATAVLVALLVRPVVHPLWAVSVCALGALYQYAMTSSLRRLRGGHESAVRLVGRLVRAQLLVWLACAVPAALVVAVTRPSLLGSGALPVLAGLAGAVLLLAVGIIFPAEDDNPLSLFAGLSVLAVVVAASALTVERLGLGTPAAIALAGAVVAAIVGHSLRSIELATSRRRHEEGPRPVQQPRRRRRPDDRLRGRAAAAHHVLDR